jgi:uncharacterized membrane protein SpoIIM required for sporulation
MASARSLDAFVTERSPRWNQLERMLDSGSAGKEILRVMTALREVRADLSLARRRYPGSPVAGQLEVLVARGQALVADVPRGSDILARARALMRFLGTALWQLVAASWRQATAAAAVLMLSGLVALTWASNDPAAARRTLPAAFRRAAVVPAHLAGLPRGVPGSAHTLTAANAAAIAVLALLGGLLAGLGTLAVLVLLGLAVGVPAGLALHAHVFTGWLDQLGSSGAVELTAIVLAAAQGLRLGGKLIDPGPLTRRAALVPVAAEAAQVLAGCLALTVAGWALTRADTHLSAGKGDTAGLLCIVVLAAVTVGRGRAPRAGDTPRAPQPADLATAPRRRAPRPG